MPTLQCTYTPPPGESKMTTMFGHTMYDGKPETITVDDREYGKLKNHPHFKCGEPSDDPVKETPPHKEVAASKPKGFQKGDD